MLPWKILGWIALSILIASVIAVSAAGYALYSTGSDAVHALAAPPLSGPGPGGTDAGAACEVQCQGDGGQALITAAMADPGAPYGCTPADLSSAPCDVHVQHVLGEGPTAADRAFAATQ